MPIWTPENEPVNLLACDGGGIRGVSELVILDEVMKRIQRKGDFKQVPKPCDYFHLIGGTSTGGLVAIMLGRLEMSTEEALEAYDSFASKIFSKANKNIFNITERYGAVALEQTVQQLVEDQSEGRPLMRDSRPRHAKGRAFVCTMPLQDRNTTVRLRTYEVEGDRFPKCMVYEAARATTAASTYFKPMILRDNRGKEQEFVDAALGRNNPITVLPEEAISLFGTQRRLGCVVSLGTGSRKAELVQARAVREMGKQIVSLLKVMKEFTTDTRRDHEQMELKFKDFPGVYFRFDVEGGAEGISLDEWKKIGKLKERTRAYLQRDEVSTYIDELAETLMNGNQHGLSLAHLGGLNRDAIVQDTLVVKPRGRASTIFTGRDAILGKIRTHFRRHEFGDISRREFHIWGMGGVGKTQIALKFAEECEQMNYQIYWIDATDMVTIQQSYRRIAQRLLPGDEHESSGAIQKVLAKLETSDDWLLVFDNAPDRGLGQYTPDGNRGNIFYTSRHKHLERRMPPGCDVNVNEMEAEDSVTLLLRSARLDPDDTTYRETAEPIAKELGYLPLALDQAGAYIYMAPCPIERFLRKFNRRKETLLKDPEFRGEDNARNLPIYTTFDISYEAIKAFARKSDPQRALKATYALQLLSLICFYHNEGSLAAIFNQAAVVRTLSEMSSWHPLTADGASLDHFVLGSESGAAGGPEWQSQDFQLGMAFLEEFSLISYDYGNMYSNMHVLVHDWARARMKKQQRAEWGLAARFILLDSMNPRDTRELIVHRRDLLPHLDACRRLVHGYSDDLGLECQYHCRIAKTYEEADRIKEAEEAHLEAITNSQKVSGFLDEDMLDLLTVLARFAKRHGNEKIAEETWLEVIDRRTLMNDERIWRGSKAKAKQGPSLKSRDGVDDHGNGEALDDSRLRDDKVSLAALYIYQNRIEDAQKHIQDILEWDRRRTKATEDDEDMHVARAWDLINENILGRKDGRITVQKAQERYLEAKESLGPDDKETIKRWKVLAERLQEEGMLKDAEKHFDEMFQWHLQTHGKSASETHEAWLRLSRNLYLQQRTIEAVAIENFVLGRYREKFGKHHPKTLGCELRLAFSLADSGFYALAVAHGKRSLEGYKIVHGLEHQRTRHAAQSLRQFRETLKTTPLFLRISLMQEKLRNSQAALEGDPRMPPWLAEWEPKPLQVMLNAKRKLVRFSLEVIETEQGEIKSWKQLEEAAFMPTQTLEEVVPPALADLLVGEGAPWNLENGAVEGEERRRMHLDIDQAGSALETLRRTERE